MHLDEEELALMAVARTEPELTDAEREHLLGCEVCRQRVAATTALAQRLDSTLSTESTLSIGFAHRMERALDQVDERSSGAWMPALSAPRLLVGLASASVAAALAVFVISPGTQQTTPWTDGVAVEGDAGGNSERELALYRDLELFEDLDALEDFEVIAAMVEDEGV